MDTLETLIANTESLETLIYWLKRLTLAVEAQNTHPPNLEEDPEEDNFGIDPNEHYTDKELQYMLNRCDKTTKRWRDEGLIEYYKGAGEKGAISYLGRFIIKFLRKYRKKKQIGKLRPVKRESQSRDA